MADTDTDAKMEFELVSPERLLVSGPFDMVVVPGAEGDFGVLPRHSLLISAVRPGVIDIYEGKEIKERVFVAGGFAEVTPERCTVLAEEAQPVGDIDRAAVEARINDLRDDLRDAKSDDDRTAIEGRLTVAEAMLAAAA